MSGASSPELGVVTARTCRCRERAVRPRLRAYRPPRLPPRPRGEPGAASRRASPIVRVGVVGNFTDDDVTRGRGTRTGQEIARHLDMETLRRPWPRDENDVVDEVEHREGIADDAERRRVEDDVVGGRRRLADDLAEAFLRARICAVEGEVP